MKTIAIVLLLSSTTYGQWGYRAIPQPPVERQVTVAVPQPPRQEQRQVTVAVPQPPRYEQRTVLQPQPPLMQPVQMQTIWIPTVRRMGPLERLFTPMYSRGFAPALAPIY